MKIERRNQVFIIRNKVIQYKYNRKKSPTYDRNITRNRIAVLYKAVKQAYNDYIIKNDFTIEVPEKMCSVRATNRKLFDRIKVGETFYLIDISHAYWAIAWRIGMLSDKLYQTYKGQKDMKRFRNMSLTSVLAPKTVENYVNGRLVSIFIENTDIYKQVYRKIRHICYNTIAQVKQSLDNNWIEYNIDGISFTEDMLEKAESIFKELQYEYSLSKCTKISEYEYVKDDGEIKHFGRKRISEIVDKNN